MAELDGRAKLDGREMLAMVELITVELGATDDELGSVTRRAARTEVNDKWV